MYIVYSEPLAQKKNLFKKLQLLSWFDFNILGHFENLSKLTRKNLIGVYFWEIINITNCCRIVERLLLHLFFK